MSDREDPDQQRRKLFRRMEWAFVYAPPLLALFIAAFGGLFLAAVVPLEGTTFWGRWALAVFIILVLPAVAYLLHTLIKR
ncbi:MAG: hypothetical protein WD737_05015 [Gemmatimonadota bacterium]